MFLNSSATTSSSAKTIVKYMLQLYFLNLRSTLVLYDSRNMNELQIIYLEAICEFQHRHEIVIQMLNVKELDQSRINLEMLQQVEEATEGFIIILPNPGKFLVGRKFAANNSVQRIKDKHHLYLQDAMNVREFFDNDHFDWDFQFWTQKYIEYKNNREPVLIKSVARDEVPFEDSLLHLYANKLGNMMGRGIKVGCHNYKPYVMFSKTEVGKGNADSIVSAHQKKDVHLFGSEGNILNELCYIWNCTLKVKNYGQDAWGELYDNGSSTGIIGGIWRNEVDVGIGSMYNWYNDQFEVANGIAKSAVRIVGPGPKRFPSYLTPVLPLPITAWIYLIVSIVLCSVTLNALRLSTIKLKRKRGSKGKLSSIILSFLDIFAMFVQQNYSKANSSGFGTRLLISATLIAALTMENIYSGQLKSLLTVPLFEDPIDTTEKFAKMGWKWGAPAIAWEDTIAESEIPKEKILAKNFEVHDVNTLRELTYTGVWGFAVEKLHSGGFTFGDYIRINDGLRWILQIDDVFYEFTRLIAIRGWPLKEKFNELVLWVFESGIYLYWERMYTEKYIDSDVLHYLIQLEKKFVPKAEPEILKISHISGPIFALVFGYILAFLVFIFELFYANLK